MERTKRVAVYPGSFDPITNGHMDIIKRALKIFDEIIIAVTDNKSKKPFFSTRQREQMIIDSTKGFNVLVMSFSGLLADFVKEHDITSVRSEEHTSELQSH